MELVKIQLADIPNNGLKDFSEEDIEGMFQSMVKSMNVKVGKLTGEDTCPFPTFLFAGVILTLPDDGIAKALISARRQIAATNAADFSGEPQQSRLVAIANEFNLCLKLNKKMNT